MMFQTIQTIHFLRVLGPQISKLILPSVSCTNTQIQKYRNTAYDKIRERPNMWYFLKRGLFKDIKNYIPMCQTHKYKNTNTKYTNTQIQHMMKCQKKPTCGIFSKRGLFKNIKNYIPMCRTHKYNNTNAQIHRYTNTAYDKGPERRNMWHIFEKRIVQGYKKLYSLTIQI